MATINKRASAGIPWDGKDKRFQMYKEVDLTAAETVDANVIQIFDVPKGVKVYGVTVQITRQAVVGTSLVMDLGITGGTTDGFDADVPLTAAAGTVTKSTPSDTYPAAGGFVATADSVLAGVLALAGTVTTPPKFKIWADCEYLAELV